MIWMKKRMVIALCCLLVLLMACSKPDETGMVENAVEETAEHTSDRAERSDFCLPPFRTTDLDGNIVTETVFSDKDLTVVNVWGTYCAPCISEMPELGAWAREMPENVQLIGIVCDLTEGDGDTHDLAVSILEHAHADFRCLAVNEDFAWLLNSISGVPTTFFVNGEGELAGRVILGAQVELYKAQVEELLNETETEG